MTSPISLQVAASGMESHQTLLDEIATNLANVNTPGYRAFQLTLKQLKPDDFTWGVTPAASGGPVGVRPAALGVDTTPGHLVMTGQPLDLAVIGEGFLPVRHGGAIAYTRAGGLHLDARGRLATGDGDLVDTTVVVPPNATNLAVQDNGDVTATVGGQPTRLGSITIARFADPSALQGLGGTLWSPSAASGAPIRGIPGTNGLGRIQSGAIEQSNVNLSDELTRIMITQRSFTLASRAFSATDQILQLATQIRQS